MNLKIVKCENGFLIIKSYENLSETQYFVAIDIGDVSSHVQEIVMKEFPVDLI